MLAAQIAGEEGVLRILIYSLAEGAALRFERGLSGGAIVRLAESPTIRLRDTVFGQALTALKPSPFAATADDASPDLPADMAARLLNAAGVEPPPATNFVFVPLLEGEEAVGLITIALSGNKTLDAQSLRILGAASPLFAVALRYEQHRAELQLHRSRIHHYREAISYRDRRYARAASALRSLSENTLRRIKADPDQEKLPPDVLREVEAQSALPLPSLFGEPPHQTQFLRWIEALAERARREAGIQTSLALDAGAVDQLVERIGAGFRNLYWLSQEAVDNVILHSQATTLEISLSEVEERLRFVIVDNGEGLVRTAGTETPERGAGLRAIRNLARAAGAHIHFGRDAKGHGLSIELEWLRAEMDLDRSLEAAKQA